MAAFEALGIGEQTWRFLNWQSRLVHPHPRQVNIADGFFDLPATTANRAEVDLLLARLAEGEDLTAHLSEGIRQGYCLHPIGKKDGPDFDLMLNEWGVHHFHLSSQQGGGGFRRRTRDVLYAIMGRGAAYVLTVAPHRAWTSRTLIRAAQRTWPRQRLFIPLGVLAPETDWSEDEHKGLRKAGLTVAALDDGKVWMSGITLGLTSALVSQRVSREAGHVLKQVVEANAHPSRLLRGLEANARRNGGGWPALPQVSLKAISAPDRYCFAFVEEFSGATLLLAPPWASAIESWSN